MSSIDSLVMTTSAPVALLNAAILALVAWSSASRNFPQRRNCSFAPGSGLKGCSCAQAVAQPPRLAANAPPANAAFIISRLVRMSFPLGYGPLAVRHFLSEPDEEPRRAMDSWALWPLIVRHIAYKIM